MTPTAYRRHARGLRDRQAFEGFRAAFTADFQQLQPVRDLEKLGDLRWLGQPQFHNSSQ
jgi:hypothetical protein